MGINKRIKRIIAWTMVLTTWAEAPLCDYLQVYLTKRET